MGDDITPTSGGSPKSPKNVGERAGINPQNPDRMPRAEDDAETIKHSPEFHDYPSPAPERKKPRT